MVLIVECFPSLGRFGSGMRICKVSMCSLKQQICLCIYGNSNVRRSRLYSNTIKIGWIWQLGGGCTRVVVRLMSMRLCGSDGDELLKALTRIAMKLWQCVCKQEKYLSFFVLYVGLWAQNYALIYTQKVIGQDYRRANFIAYAYNV